VIRALTIALCALALWNMEAHAAITCEQHNFDVAKITRALMHDVPKETVLYHLGPGTGMEADRVEAIKAMIEDAYKTTDRAESWRARNMFKCEDA
jgi:hypothetical protein